MSKYRSQIECIGKTMEALTQRTFVETMDEFVGFALWASELLRSRPECIRLWPEHTKDEDDWDLGGQFNYVYHRYRMFGGNCFLSFLRSTPTFRDSIVGRLKQEYGKPVTDLCVVAGHLGQHGDHHMADEAVLLGYKSASPEDRERMALDALERAMRSNSLDSVLSA